MKANCPRCGAPVTLMPRDPERRGNVLEMPRPALCAACTARDRQKISGALGGLVLAIIFFGAILWRVTTPHAPPEAPPEPINLQIQPHPDVPPHPADVVSVPQKLRPTNPATWVTNDDYPPAAQREGRGGTTAFKLQIAANGRVSDCTVTESSGHSDLDNATCRLITARARFTPGRDEQGNAIGGSFSSRVRWQIQN